MSLRESGAPDAETCGYRHDALFYSGLEEFADSIGTFAAAGVEADEAVLVVVSAAKIKLLREWLGPLASGVVFGDMAEIGKNPGRIIPVWREFVDANTHRPMRGVGEPVYPERSADEMLECSRHESLLNIAFDAQEDFWLVCPYDVSVLAEPVVEEALRNHPWWVAGDNRRASGTYRPVDLVAPFADPLPPLPGRAQKIRFTARDMHDVRVLLSNVAKTVGFTSEREWDLLVAVSELAANSIQHGGGSGTVRVVRGDDKVVVDVIDTGTVDHPLVGRVNPEVAQSSGRGLWMANQLGDLLQLHSSPSGTVVRLHMSR